MLFAVAYASAGPRAAQRLRFTMADRSRGEASTSAPVQFKRGRAGKRRQRQQSPGDEGDAAAIKQAKPELKGAIQVSTARQAGQGLLDDAFTGTGEIQQHGDLGATRALESETLRGQDERSLKEAGMKAGEDEDGKYRGMSGYKDWRGGFRREEKVAVYGPQRVSQHVRSTIRIDYQPDICKDYKETGFCSYGDSCKFMHDRGDYKSGWELDRDWEAEQKAKRQAKQLRMMEGKGSEESGSSDSDEDEVPFACYVCRRAWQECTTGPVKTKCGHVFCEECALRRSAKSGKCAVCEQQTLGIFNVADDVVRKFELDKKGAAAGPSAAAAVEAGGRGWEEDEGGWS